jgi:hypothetical protein
VCWRCSNAWGEFLFISFLSDLPPPPNKKTKQKSFS